MPWGMRDAETSGISIISDGYVGATPRASLDPRLKSSACGSISVITILEQIAPKFYIRFLVFL